MRSVHSTENALYWLYRESLVCKADCANVCRARSARDAHTRLAKLIEALGYDGIVHEKDEEGGAADRNEDYYAVFWPDQIRSAFELDSRYLTSDWKNPSFAELRNKSPFRPCLLQRPSQHAPGRLWLFCCDGRQINCICG